MNAFNEIIKRLEAQKQEYFKAAEEAVRFTETAQKYRFKAGGIAIAINIVSDVAEEIGDRAEPFKELPLAESSEFSKPRLPKALR